MESYDVLGKPYNQLEDKQAIITQILEDSKYGSGIGKPSENFKIVFVTNDKIRVVYHSYEVNLHERIKEVDDQAKTMIKEYVKFLKNEYKRRVHKTLKLTEVKNSRDYSVEKVSLNCRYYYRHWVDYKID